MKNESVILFGCGKDAEENYDKVSNDYSVVAACDNNEKIWGNEWRGYKILSPKEAIGLKYDYIYVATSKYCFEIKQQLLSEFGIPEEKIIIEFNKYDSEVDYWEKRYKEEKEFHNEHYKRLMLGIADEVDDKFWKDKVVADFGCGPRGSLVWTKTPRTKIGIDVLVPRYMDKFNLTKHDMIYVTSSEKCIPLPDNSVDVLLTINSLDHVDNLDLITKELLRILKPGGMLLASFNLNEPSCFCEPQTLTEEILEKILLHNFDTCSYRLALKDPEDTYRNMFLGKMLNPKESLEEQVLWYKGIKKE